MEPLPTWTAVSPPYPDPMPTFVNLYPGVLEALTMNAVLHCVQIDITSCSIAAAGILRLVRRIGQQHTNEACENQDVADFEAVNPAD